MAWEFPHLCGNIRVLLDGMGIPSFVWQHPSLFDGMGIPTLVWQHPSLFDGMGNSHICVATSEFV